MTVREYMQETGGNLSWCKPYFSGDGESAVAINEGEPVGVLIDGADVAPREISKPETIRRLAQAVNAQYALYSGWDDLHIALEAMHEGDCCECPWFGLCDAMDGDVETGPEV